MFLLSPLICSRRRTEPAGRPPYLHPPSPPVTLTHNAVLYYERTKRAIRKRRRRQQHTHSLKVHAQFIFDLIEQRNVCARTAQLRRFDSNRICRSGQSQSGTYANITSELHTGTHARTPTVRPGPAQPRSLAAVDAAALELLASDRGAI